MASNNCVKAVSKLSRVKIIYSIFLFIVFTLAESNQLSAQQPIKVSIKKTDSAFVLIRDQKPYYVIGAGGDTHLELLKKIGGNSIRTWGIDNAQEILDKAEQLGLTVTLGLWIQHERHGFDYNNEIKVKNQITYFKSVIDKFKNHPALLMWGIGNEVDLFYTNTKVWNSIEAIAEYAHQVDPNHPTTTVTAGLDSLEVDLIKRNAPNIDIYSVNTYGDIANVPQNIKKFGWTGPYMITEWGPNGHWESPQTKWGASIEQSSTEKAAVYYSRYKNYIEANKNQCLGSYVFLWGQKQEYTETWYGLFTKEQLQTEAIDALELAWTGIPPQSPTPIVNTIKINELLPSENIELKANATALARFNFSLKIYEKQLNDSSNIKLDYRILKESSDKKAGGDVENEAEEIATHFKKTKTADIQFQVPNEIGAYRLYVRAIYKGKVSYTNCPFMVKENPVRGNGKKVWIKKWEMESLNN